MHKRAQRRRQLALSPVLVAERVGPSTHVQLLVHKFLLSSAAAAAAESGQP